MKTLFNILLLSGVFSLSFTTNAVTIPSQVMANYQEGIRGNSNANTQAIEQLTLLRKKDHKDIIVLALLGSSETTQARYNSLPWQKMKFAEQGMGKLDKALRILSNKAHASAFETLQVNTTAGCTFVSVPSMFNRFDQGYQLLMNTIAMPMFSQAPTKAKVATYLCAAKAAAKAKDKVHALKYIASLEKLTPHAPFMANMNNLKAQLEE